jgi:hypothetical protein
VFNLQAGHDGRDVMHVAMQELGMIQDRIWRDLPRSRIVVAGDMNRGLPGGKATLRARSGSTFVEITALRSDTRPTCCFDDHVTDVDLFRDQSFDQIWVAGFHPKGGGTNEVIHPWAWRRSGGDDDDDGAPRIGGGVHRSRLYSDHLPVVGYINVKESRSGR